MSIFKKVASDPSLLCHPNIPKPLHGINPRTIYGKAWWDKHRQEAYRAADFRCQACGVPKEDAKKFKWLEAHEYYDIDYVKGVATFVKLVALCHFCHNYIHDGRLRMLLDSGEMDQSEYDAIIKHGDDIIAGHPDLVKRRANRHVLHTPDNGLKIPAWNEWRMSVDGKLYGPSSVSMQDWQAGAWKKWSVASKS